jgi:hypothetical protein
MTRVGARFVLPLLATAALWAGSALSGRGQTLNTESNNDRDMSGRATSPVHTTSAKRIKPLYSTLRTNRSYDAVFTHIHGPDNDNSPFEQILELMHVLSLEIALDDSTRHFAFLRAGNGTDSVGRRAINGISGVMMGANSNLYNMLVCFHGTAAIDSAHFATHNKAIVYGQVLRNSDIDSPKRKHTRDLDVMVDITNGLWDGRDADDRFNIVWASCQGGAAARIMGGFPPNSTVLVESDAFHDLWLNQQSFAQAFKSTEIWKPIPAHQFLEARLFFQNSMEHDMDTAWNDHPLVFFTTADRRLRPAVTIGADTVALAPRKAHVLDFAELTHGLYKKFGPETLHKTAQKYADFIETATLVRGVSIADKGKTDPHYHTPPQSYFDNNLADITIRKLARVRSHADFMKKLNDPERKFARILALALYSASDSHDTLETAEDYVQRKHILPLNAGPADPR